MRRGLISWSRAELPEAVLDARIAAAQAALAKSKLDALVVYTTPARAAGVSWLAGFVPYWNQGLLVVPRTGRPILVSALSNRVADWLQRNAHVAEVRNSPRIGAEAANFIAQSTPRAAIGVVDMPALPATIIAELTASGHSATDASSLLAGLRRTPDPADLALHCRAASIAHRAISADFSAARDAGDIAALIDRIARNDGAEEVYPTIATDLTRSRSLIRIEGASNLSDTFAIKVSLAYKGAWVRLTRTIDRTPDAAARLQAAAVQFASAVSALPDTSGLAASRTWLIEATRTTMPLEALAGTVVEDALPIEPGSLINVQATIETAGKYVLLGGPALVGSDRIPTSLLIAPA